MTPITFPLTQTSNKIIMRKSKITRTLEIKITTIILILIISIKIIILFTNKDNFYKANYQMNYNLCLITTTRHKKTVTIAL